MVISVGEGMAASTSIEGMDAMFQPRPHGVIAVDPLSSIHISVEAKSTLCPGRAEVREPARVAGGLGQQPIAKSRDLAGGCFEGLQPIEGR